MEADILVIQECENPSLSTEDYRHWAGHYFWHGENKHKGIGIFIRSDIKATLLNWKDQGFQSFLPCRIEDAFNLVAVWTKQVNSYNASYVGQLWAYIQVNRKLMAKDRLLICGDFNSNACWDKKHTHNHSDVVKELGDMDVHSLYHHYYEEEQSKETRPTFFLQKNREKPYHIDYAFASGNLFAGHSNPVYIGSSDDWLEHSDHMPLEFTISC